MTPFQSRNLLQKKAFIQRDESVSSAVPP